MSPPSEYRPARVGDALPRISPDLEVAYRIYGPGLDDAELLRTLAKGLVEDAELQNSIMGSLKIEILKDFLSVAEKAMFAYETEIERLKVVYEEQAIAEERHEQRKTKRAAEALCAEPSKQRRRNKSIQLRNQRSTPMDPDTIDFTNDEPATKRVRCNGSNRQKDPQATSKTSKTSPTGRKSELWEGKDKLIIIIDDDSDEE